MILAVIAAIVMLVGFAVPAGADGKAGHRSGPTELHQRLAERRERYLGGGDRPTEQISLNIVSAQDPNQPGMTPAGGGGGCPTRIRCGG